MGRAATLLVCLLPLLGACMTTKDMPAVVVAHDVASHAELTRVVSLALGTTSLLLADDVLTTSNRLTIERAQARTIAGRIDAREVEMPEQFFLLANGDACFLLHERSGKRLPLREVTCKPLPQ